MAADNNVDIKVSAIVNGTPAVDALGKSLDATGKDAVKLGAGAKDTAASFDALGQSAFNFNNIKTAVEDMVRAMGGVPLEVLKTADAYNNLAARIKLVTGEGAAFQSAFEGVQKVAIATRSDLEATGTLFARIATAGKDMGISQQQALVLTQTINQAIQVSGASAASSDAAITQLIQGLQSGVLRGEEFNSVMEQAPRLAKALADGLGVGTGELRKMAEQGQLTSTTVMKALQGQSDAVAAEFAKLPPTVGGALTNLGTAWKIYVGEVDKSTGATVTAANAINSLAENIRPVAGFLVDAGKAFAAVAALKMAEYLYGVGQAAQQAATAIAAKTAATAASTVATAASAAATAKDAQATVELTAVVDLNRASTEAVVRTHAVSTAALLENAAAAKAAALGYNSINSAMTGYVPAMQAAPKAIESTSKATDSLRLGMSGSAEAITDVTAKIKPASAGMDTLGKAADGTKKSMFEGASAASLLGQGFVAAGTAASGAFTLAGSAARSFLALIGGIPGMALMILVNAKEIGTWLGEFVAKHTSAGKQLADNEAKLAAIEAELKKKLEERAAAEAKLNAESDKALFALIKSREEAEKRVTAIEKEVKAVEAQAKASEAIIKLSGQEVSIAEELAYQSSVVANAKFKLAEANEKVVSAIQGQIDKTNEQIALQNGKATKAQTDELKRLGELIEGKTNEAAAAWAIADAVKTEAEARDLASKALNDNAQDMLIYAKAVDDARIKLDILEMSGVASQNAILAATLQLNKAIGLENDARKDLLQTVGEENKASQASISASISALSAREKHLLVMAKQAAAHGDVAKAQALEDQARRASIEIENLKIKAIEDEVAASTKEIAIKRSTADASTDVGRALLAELKVQEENNKAKLAGVQVSKDRIKELEKEASGIGKVEQAMKDLGITSDAELNAIAEKSRSAFETLSQSGTASARELREAFKKYAEDAIKANNGVANEFIKSQAAAHGLAIEVDSTGKAIVKAMDAGAAATKNATGYMDAFKLSAMKATAELEKQNAELEKTIAAEEKAIELKERLAELERKKKNVDKDGFELGPDGKRLEVGVPTKAGVFEQAKSRGLTEKQALEISDQFINDSGNKIGWQGTGKSWTVVLNEAIEKMILDNARNNTGSGTGGGGKPLKTTTPDTPPTQTVHVKIAMPDGSIKDVVTDSAGSQSLQDVIKELANAKKSTA